MELQERMTEAEGKFHGKRGEGIQRKTACKVLSQKPQDIEQAIAVIRDDDIWQGGMGMFTVVTENPHHTKIGFFPLADPKINDRTSVVVVDVAVAGTSADGTGLLFWLKFIHVGIEQKF